MLTLIHGHEAPTESSLKKWSASGEFSACIVAEDATAAASAASRAGEVTRARRVGRPGLSLHTQAAMNRVYELWPHLTDSGTHAALDLAVARAADRLESRLTHLVGVPPSPSPVPEAGTDVETKTLMAQVLEQIAALRQDMVEVKREVAQFSAMRNNLITKLDDAVARAQEAIAAGAGRSGSGADPLVEARRDRDMGVVKSMLSEILASQGGNRPAL
ncbi:hypothetical protein [Variovorax sp. GT1P44]|uniref:hypothetical protein n=1 Tax=Variovorax sp. GT1P44 TaxID=3443742 RepID=UPI003F47D9C2